MMQIVNSMPNPHYLWIEIESLQRVDNKRVLCQPIVHDHVEAFQERWSLNNGLIVGIVQTLKSKEDKYTWLEKKNLKKTKKLERNVKVDRQRDRERRTKAKNKEKGKPDGKTQQTDTKYNSTTYSSNRRGTIELYSVNRWQQLTAQLVAHSRREWRKKYRFASDYCVTFDVVSPKGMKLGCMLTIGNTVIAMGTHRHMLH